MVYGLCMVLVDGSILEIFIGIGVDWIQLVVGSEGILGLVIFVILCIHFFL